MSEIKIRLAHLDDITNIVYLLKKSLGESQLPKSAEIWKYKHISNPFGPSVVVLAELESRIIGVRAFMRWDWQLENKIFKAYRAVDTAVHPDFQRKGLFKKMNSLGKKEIENYSGDFIFNTPNNNSLPGNLKMGALKIGKIPVAINFTNPFQWIFPKLNNINNRSRDEKISGSCISEHNEKLILRKKLFTPKSIQYLDWRYSRNPLRNYIIEQENDYFVAAYVREHKFFNELRVVEKISISKDGNSKANDAIKQLAIVKGVKLITSSIDDRIYVLSLKGEFGPILVMKSINSDKMMLEYFQNYENWNVYLGDLELF